VKVAADEDRSPKVEVLPTVGADRSSGSEGRSGGSMGEQPVDAESKPPGDIKEACVTGATIGFLPVSNPITLDCQVESVPVPPNNRHRAG
jgi:hypothetical protein